MARVNPEGWREIRATGSLAREIETLSVLAEGLDDRYAVYHGVHWSRVHEIARASVGEIDFVIVGPGGRVLLIEQKTGFLEETPDGLCKVYVDGAKSVPVQIARNKENFHNRLRKLPGGGETPVEILLYCPDHTVKDPGTAGIDPSRIVDGRRKDRLVEIITAILPSGGDVPPPNAPIHRFLGELLDLVPNVGASVQGVGALQTRLSEGLAHWGRRIEVDPFRLRVVGTAGSGKTQLALAVYTDAVRRGERALYVCYNRPLADHIAVIATPGGTVTTYHHLADRISRANGTVPNFGSSDVYASMEAAMDRYHPTDGDLVDTLIVDEGQDFNSRWAENLFRFLKPGGRAWWLEDPMQNLYDRPAVPLPGWTRLRADINYRSPREIVAFLNRLLPVGGQIHAGSPLSDAEIDFLTYSDTPSLIEQTVEAVNRCVKQGFKRDQIAIVTYRGRESSWLTPYDQIGGHRLRAPTGQYDLLGNSIYTEGNVAIDSVHRFKGRAAPCIVLTEIDFENLTENSIRRLFVGATRATMKLVLVLSDAAANVLLNQKSETQR